MTEQWHFVGIGGAGMSGLARLLTGAGARVTGSDLKESDSTHALRAAGIPVAIGHRAANVSGATHVVHTAAVPPSNPELLEARRRGLPVLVRAELLARVMEGRRGVAIAGTHGKTTTTAMAGSVFLAAGKDPTLLIGGDWPPIGGNARAGAGAWFVAEACEAFDSFLELHPHVALVTNVEADHLDWHGSLEGVAAAFARFLAAIQPGGYAIGCADDPRVRRLLAALDRRSVTWALDHPADYTAAHVRLDGPSPAFTLLRAGEALGEVRLAVPGRHNVQNALAAAALGIEEGLPFASIAAGLAAFRGVARRFETLGEARGVLVIDDYAHHPTEIAATLAAARRALDRPLTAVFQPHLYSRTRLLAEQFARCFADADRVILTEVYAAREEPLDGVGGEWLARRIRDASPHKPVEFAPEPEALVRRLVRLARPGDAVLTLGAGDIRAVGEALVRRLQQRERKDDPSADPASRRRESAW